MIRRISQFGVLAAALAPFVAGLACGSSKTPDAPAPDSFRARFVHASGARADFVDVPFPNDAFVDDKGVIGFPIGTNENPTGVNKFFANDKGAQYLADAFAHSPGFGVYGGAFFAVEGGVVQTSNFPTGAAGDCSKASDAAFLFDVDAGATIPCRLDWVDERAFGDKDVPPTLTVRPARGVVLAEGHRILAALTDAIRSDSGATLTATQDFQAIRDGRRGDAMEKSLADAIAALTSKVGVDRSHLVVATTWSTGHVTDDLRAARELAAATPLPTLGWDKDAVAPVAPAKFTSSPLPSGWTATLDDWLGQPRKLTSGPRSGEDDPDWANDNTGVAHDAIGAVGVASFMAPSFLDVACHPEKPGVICKPPALGDYDDPDHGTFHHDASGALAFDPTNPTAKIWVTFVVPKTPPPSAAGYPVVVFQHGLGGQRADCLQIANTLAHQGWATAAIEVVLHGTRKKESIIRGDAHNDAKRSTSKYDGPDGFTDRNTGGDYPIDFFGGLFRLAAFRDQLRQGAIDHTTLLRLLRSSPTLDGLAVGGVAPKIDGTKVAYMGDSLGGITGAVVAGIEPNHRAYVLNVPGAAILTELAPNAPTLADLVGGATGLFFGVHGQTPPAHPLLQLMEHVMDGGDPIGVVGTVFAPRPIAGTTPPPRNVLMFEAVRDEIVANESTEALARAMGIPIVVPHEAKLLADLTDVDGAAGVHDVPVAGATGALVQLSPAQHGYDLFAKPGRRDYSSEGPVYGDLSSSIFPKLPTPYTFDNPYIEAQALAVQFIKDAFDGKVPNVVWTKVPEPVTK